MAKASFPPKLKGAGDERALRSLHLTVRILHSLVWFQREDDRPESIRVRMDAYQRSTLPLVEFYTRAGLLLSIAAEETPEITFKRTVTLLEI